MREYYVYILTNKYNTALYTGVTNDLERRLYEHKNKLNPKSFSANYNLNKLVYFEIYTDIESAILREKQIKAGSRQKKFDLIKSMNKNFDDLSKYHLEL
jgi:putative endonuclease